MIRCLQQFHLNTPFRQWRSVPVAMGPDKPEAILFIHSQNQVSCDPWTESMNFPTDTLHLTLMDMDDNVLWSKDLGHGIIPGVWFSPVMSFDLDGDGVDEIWTLGNTTPHRPFTVENRTLERYDPLSGELTGSWHFPAQNTSHYKMSESYRYTLACGYVHGSPVLVTAQGTYGDMFLQGWDPGIVSRWNKFIPANEPGARASHVYPILDFNGDGIDELFWGERVLSFDDGHEILCYDRALHHAHSDIVTPFVDPKNEKLYIYTCREGGKTPERVAVFDALSGEAVWRWPQGGHMHNGWLASCFDGRRHLAYAMSLAIKASGGDIHRSTPIHYYFDALTGEPMDNPLPF